MRKIKMISVLMLAVLLTGVLTLGVSAEQYPDYLVSVTDKDNLLSTEDERRINETRKKIWVTFLSVFLF